MSKLYIFTLNWNGADKLVKLEPTLMRAIGPMFYSDGRLKDGVEQPIWYIRDNGSKDSSLEEIEKWRLAGWRTVPTKVFDIGHNRDSFAKGMNFLFEQANPADDDVILLLNNDVIIEGPHSIQEMLDLMNRTGAAVVGARLLYTNTRRLQHAGVIFGPKYGNMPYHYRPNEPPDQRSNTNRYFQAVTAAVCMVRAGSFRRIGGMDEGYRWAFEDIDMCLQIGQTEKIAYCGKTVILHEESASLKKNPVQKMFMSSNVNYFKQKWWNNGKPRYILDHQRYIDNSSYNEIKGH